jgi:peptide/nickel transport system substrate-binding protein
MSAKRSPAARAVSRFGRRRLLASGAGISGSVLIGLSAAACAGRSTATTGSGQASTASAGQQPQPGGTLNIYAATNQVLDGQKTSSGPGPVVGGAQSRVFRIKTTADPKVYEDHDIESDLGLSAESPDAMTWTIKLRPGAKFHDIPPVSGHAVEADDIKATFARAIDPATANPNRGSLAMIDPAQIETPDAQTVVFKLLYPYAPFRKALASTSYAWIFPREVLNGGYDPAKTVIGSGPFIVDSVQPDVASTVKRNPGWFESGRPYLDGIRVAIVPDGQQQLAQFSAANLDVLLVDNSNDLQTASQRNPKAAVIKAVDGRAFPIYGQLGDPTSPFQDIRVRQAISMAIDREALGKAIFNGQTVYKLFVPGYLGKWALGPEDLPQSSQQYFQHNPAEAKKLLAGAGQSNLQLRFAYVSNGTFTTPAYVQQAQTIASMMNDAGIKTNLVTQDYNKEFIGGGKGSRQGNFDKDVVGFFAEAVYTEADDYLYIYFHSKSTSNGEKLKDPILDAMIDKERTIVDEDARLRAIQDIEKYIADKMYVIPTVGSYEWYLTQPRVQQFRYSKAANFTESYANVWLSAK